MNNSSRISHDFAECKYLVNRFGNEENFRVLSENEYAAMASSKLILDFLKQKVLELAKAGGGKALNWVTAELLKAFDIGGTPNDLEEIKSLLRRIVELQEQSLDKLDEVLKEVQFQSVAGEAANAVHTITSFYKDLRNLSLIENDVERKERADKLTQAIVSESGSGVIFNLRIINTVLTTTSSLSKNGPLIKLFADRWFNDYRKKQFQRNYPLSAYYRALDQWLHELSIIQYMGVSSLANARIAQGHYESLKIDMDEIIQGMETQQKLLSNEIPEWTRTLPEEVLKPDSWFVIRGFGIGGRPSTDDSQVVYGPPDSDRYNMVRFRDRHALNWDEEWRFEKITGDKDAFEDDVFRLVTRTGFYIYLDKQNLRTTKWTPDYSKRPELRLLMGRSQDPNVKPDTPRKHAYIPVIGFVDKEKEDKSNCIIPKLSMGTIETISGPENNAIRFRIVRP